MEIQPVFIGCLMFWSLVSHPDVCFGTYLLILPSGQASAPVFLLTVQSDRLSREATLPEVALWYFSGVYFVASYDRILERNEVLRRYITSTPSEH
ncbi:hypothetical protein BJ875DRAFT_465835 [Amylocarpus encephaloides]|uniref:Uncharacterized protein n=1 Tax=Amylocarpus encephaloides TaxID=45428 RepID=A0A9P7YFS5_9HELO|nr:hypothetical protein BJ875DRAFT_465835 [Amylocarpus encephaloides]